MISVTGDTLKACENRDIKQPREIKKMTTAKQIKAINKELKLTRLVVNSLEFGTVEWDSAMTVVRELCEKINSLTDFGDYTSIDGDVFQKH